MIAAGPYGRLLRLGLLILRVTPEDRIAEARTWASTALLGGISAGTAAGGTLVERYSRNVALIAAAAATVLAAVAADPAARRLAPAKAVHTTP